MPAFSATAPAPRSGRWTWRSILHRYADRLESRTSLLLLLGDMAAFALALVLTLGMRHPELPPAAVLGEHLAPSSGVFALWAAVFLIAGLYDQYVDLDRKALPRRLVEVQALNALTAGAAIVLLPLDDAAKGSLLVSFAVSSGLLLVWRLSLYPHLFGRPLLEALVIGNPAEAAEVARVLSRNPRFAHVSVEHVDPGRYPDAAGAAAAIRRRLAAREVELVVADLDIDAVGALTPLFFDVAFTARRARFYSLSDFHEHLHHRIPPSVLREEWLLRNVAPQGPHCAYDFLKRVLDILALFLVLPLLALFPLVMAAIKLEDGGPVFYCSERVGRFGKPIRIVKFRTMSGMDVGDQALRSRLVETRVGRILRRTRLDELPQLLNVLRGDMSFIGPRPEMPALARVYRQQIPYYDMRHLVKPGLSGWAQVRDVDAPRKGVDVERTARKLSYDLYYLRHRSLLLDLEIVLRTVNTVLSRSGD